ncbi:MAG: hypothetical protein ACR2JV_08505 [Gaiellales bacterium]
MRRLAVLTALSLLVVLGGAAIASAAPEFESHEAYSCDTAWHYNTGCAVIDNQVTSWGLTSPEPQHAKRLFFVAPVAARSTDMAVQRVIAPQQSGSAIIGWRCCNESDATVVYGFQVGYAFQALVGMRMSSTDPTTFACIEMNYLACDMGGDLGSSGHPKRRFTITSRPVEVKIVNDMPVALRRVDGPYLSKMLSSTKDTGELIEPKSSGAVGTLRSVVSTSAFAAVYKFARSADDPRYNAASVLINVKIAKNGKNDGSKCTAVYLKNGNGAPFECTVDFRGSGFLTAIVRVSPI